MHYCQGFTIVELLIVVIIIGILVTFAAPQFITTRERALDKEAQANLKLIQAAEKIYRTEVGGYFPPPGYSGPWSNQVLNDNLKLSVATQGKWTYYTDSNGFAVACKNPACSKYWYMYMSYEEPACQSNPEPCLP